ncbi:MAG TPA: peptidylprolyl isomerase [Bacteroidota bacterium]|nr:peptidylprolyl isomerase [Bacteroidota bacterium]
MIRLRHMPVIAGAILSFSMWSCSPKGGAEIVAEVGSSKVDLKEYERFYAKNGGGEDAARKSTQAERERFLDLLTQYRLKLQDAYDRKLDADSSIEAELKDYRNSLATSYVVDEELTNPAVRKMYKRRSEELRVQQIEIASRPGAAPPETLKAYAKALEIVKRAQLGEPFDSLVEKYSEDPNAKADHGDLYYFTSGEINPSFEDSAYELQKGQISKFPVRSPAGYHILKVTDRRPSSGLVKIRHIMARTESSQPKDTLAAYNRILGIQDTLKKGRDFAQVATRFSEDAGSAPTGGLLGWTEVRHWYQAFDEAAMKLKPGENSPIIRTPWGYHIIHCDSAKPIPPFEDMQDTLKKTYQQLRYFGDYTAFIGKLKTEYGYKFNDSLFTVFADSLDSTKTVDDSGWASQLPLSMHKAQLILVNGKSITLDSAISILMVKPEFRNTSLHAADMYQALDRVGENLLLLEKAVGLEQRSPEFAQMMQEYKDGVVLFKAEQTQVWDRVSVSDTTLHKYYSSHTDKFMAPAEIQYAEIHVPTDTMAILVYDSLSRGGDFADFAKRYDDDADLKANGGVHGFEPVVTSSVTGLADSLKIGEISDPIELENGGYSIIKPIAKHPSRPKTFEEAGAELSNAVQEDESKRLEKEWIDSLTVKYSVKEYKDRLSAAFAVAKN